MKHSHLIVSLFSLGTLAAQGDVLRLADGTVLEGELGAPTEVTVKTAAGEKSIAFSLLPPEVQQRYWRKSAESAALASVPATPVAVAPVAPAPTVAPVSDDDLATLAAAVRLDTWEEVASFTSFRDKAEKRGTGGLIVTKAFNALEENWATVYPVKDPVGASKTWDAQVAMARGLQERAPQFVQRRWLELFIKAGEAVSRKDSTEFATLVRELKRNPLTTASVASGDVSKNFFTAK